MVINTLRLAKEKNIPSKWKKSVLIPILKKGEKQTLQTITSLLSFDCYKDSKF